MSFLKTILIKNYKSYRDEEIQQQSCMQKAPFGKIWALQVEWPKRRCVYSAEMSYYYFFLNYKLYQHEEIQQQSCMQKAPFGQI